MDQTHANISALNFSPFFWWKTIERGISFTEIFAKELYPEINFRNWLQTAIIEHNSLEICEEIPPSAEYSRMVSNHYFYQVAAINLYGHKIIAKSEEKLFENQTVPAKAEIIYQFKIDDLQHLVMQHFMSWLLLGTHFHWVRWQLYFDFIVQKVDGSLKEMYYYMWSVIMAEINHHHHFFEKIDHYKMFRDKYEEVSKISNVFENKFIALRDDNKT